MDVLLPLQDDARAQQSIALSCDWRERCRWSHGAGGVRRDVLGSRRDGEETMKRKIALFSALFFLTGCAALKPVNHCPVAKIEVYQKSPNQNFNPEKGKRRGSHENAVSTI